jgi:hypothetical protein
MRTIPLSLRGGALKGEDEAIAGQMISDLSEFLSKLSIRAIRNHLRFLRLRCAMRAGMFRR